jgi:hypothetical protein
MECLELIHSAGVYAHATITGGERRRLGKQWPDTGVVESRDDL